METTTCGWQDETGTWAEIEPAEGPYFRREAQSSPFPPCRALLRWPGNYPVHEMVDLNENEMAEVDPAKFVYCHAEMVEWSRIVNRLVDELEAPREIFGRTVVFTAPKQARDRIPIRDWTRYENDVAGFFRPHRIDPSKTFFDLDPNPRLERVRATRKERGGLFF